MPDDYTIGPSDLLDTWVMVTKRGEHTQHFRTRTEAERYASEPACREGIKRKWASSNPSGK